MEAKKTKNVLAAISDLFFGSKVSGTARPLGVEVRFATTPQALLEGLRSGPDLVIVDLDAAHLDPLGAIGQVRQAGGPRVIAFANHTRVDLIERAGAAGCEEVHTRGSLAAGLRRILASL